VIRILFAVLFAVLFAEMSCGKHPTQESLCVLSRTIQASTGPGAWILDPCSSTTGIAATLLGHRFLGIDQSDKILELGKARREEHNSYAIHGEYLEKSKIIAKLFEDKGIRVQGPKENWQLPKPNQPSRLTQQEYRPTQSNFTEL